MRILIELLSSDPQVWRQVDTYVRSVGASELREPRSTLPGVAMVVFPEDVDVRAIIGKLESLPGVGRVEVDALREMF